MYNPLIEIKHTDGSFSYVRHSDICTIRYWKSDKSITLKDGRKFSYVTNILDIVKLSKEIENRNEATELFNK